MKIQNPFGFLPQGVGLPGSNRKPATPEPCRDEQTGRRKRLLLRRATRGLWASFVLLLGGLLPVSSWAEPNPSQGAAVVDGLIGDWQFGSDYFGDLSHYTPSGSTLLARLYLRYDCANEVLYALVLQIAEDYPIITRDAEETVIRIDRKVRVNAGVGNNGTPPDFAWVGAGYAGSGTARGWEASFFLDPGTYTLFVHNNMWDGSEEQTVRTRNPGLTLTTFCQPPDELLAALGNVVWNDVDNDGVYAPEQGFDAPLAGVGVELWRDLDGNRTFEPSGADAQTPRTTSTSASGHYLFSGLDPGVYFVYIPTPPPFHVWSSVLTSLNDDQVDNDDNGIQENYVGAPTVSSAIELSPREIDLTIDFAFVDPGVGNLVWHDVNRDGHVDADEPGIPKVVLWLYEVPGGTGTPVWLAESSTGSEGFYYFGGLYPGFYQVVIPELNFERGGALEFLRHSSPDGSVVDDGEDDDDNGIQVSPGGRTSSPVFNLLEEWEPTDLDTETGRGHTQDNEPAAVDIDNDLTKDFGFWGEPPTAARLDGFTAVRLGPTQVRVVWSTRVEFDLIGFHLERSATAGAWEPISEGLIPAFGSEGRPHTYQAADLELPEATQVRYRLMGVTTRGGREVLATTGLNAGLKTHLRATETTVMLEVTGAAEAYVLIETAERVRGPWTHIEAASLDVAGKATVSLASAPGASARFYRIR